MRAMNRQVSIEIADDLAVDLQEYSAATGRTTDEAVAEALRSFLRARSTAPKRSFADRLRESGALGAVKDAPGDLSENKKYFEGFGE